MLPLGTLKLTSRRTTWSSKAKLTLSNTTADNTAGACEVTSPTDGHSGQSARSRLRPESSDAAS